MQLHFLVLKPHRIIHFSDVPKCSEDTLAKPDEDSTDVIEDIWTLDEQVLQALASEFLTTAPDEVDWHSHRVGVCCNQMADVPYGSIPACQLFGQLNSSILLDHLVDLSFVGLLPFWFLSQLLLSPQERFFDCSPVV